MSSSSDDALRERAAFDENAAELLRLAVEKGLMSAGEADTAAAAVREQYTAAENAGSPPPVIDALEVTGPLDRDTLDSLARELGMITGPSEAGGSAESPFSDPFDVPPVREWDRYELIEFIGRGGMGDVYKARDPRLGRYVALKFLRRDTPDIAARFMREARVQARIDHDNVCQVYEVGEVEGHSYIAMQYIAGGSLKQITDLLSLREKAEIMVDVADALHAAHQAGLIHRDVKPANILVERSDDGSWRPFVVDFGIARDVDSRDVTVSGMVLGTPAFAAPEQVRGETRNLDRRTDVYSLGATMYWFLTDRPPYDGGYPEVLAGITDREPTPPHRINPDTPVDLETIVLKCLEKEPDRRYATAREVSEDLRRFLTAEPITARPASLIYKVGKKIRKHRGLTAATAAVLAAFVTVTLLGVRSNLQARRQAAIAQTLLEQVTEIEAMVRITSMMPLHDRRPDEQLIRARMEQISTDIERYGELSLGPGHYALGRGHLALQDYQTALDHLQAASDAGYRTPGVSYALGLVLGRLYEQQLQEARQIDDRALREAFRSDIETRFKEPALANLRSGRDPATEAAAYAEGLIALYEGRYEWALDKAREAFEQVEWLYEAKKLEGDILLEIGSQLGYRGDYPAALEQFRFAGQAYATAAEIARSDASIYEGDCARWTHVMDTEVRRGGVPDPAYDAALAACTMALHVDPDRSEVHERLSRLHWRWADVVNDRGGDPTPDLERAVASAGRAISLDATSASAHFVMGGALTVTGLHELATGRDPLPTLERAVASLKRAVELEPGMVLAHDDLGYAHERIALYEMSAGVDPRPSLDRAASSFRRAIQLEPDYANAHNNLGIALWRRAYYELRIGLDPGPALDNALAALAEATSLNPNYAYAFANRGLAYRTKALVALDRADDPTPWVELARASFDRAIEINSKIFWAYPERASVELIAARWAMSSGREPGPYLDRAQTAALRAVQVNPANATAYQTAAEVHRWRAEWWLHTERDVRPETAAGRRMTAESLGRNPNFANALLTDAALDLVEAEAIPRVRAELIPRCLATIDRATELNPSMARDAERLRERARSLAPAGPR
jgi:serine/threonine-protein kinase